jgi:hypothetical protein
MPQKWEKPGHCGRVTINIDSDVTGEVARYEPTVNDRVQLRHCIRWRFRPLNPSPSGGRDHQLVNHPADGVRIDVRVDRLLHQDAMICPHIVKRFAGDLVPVNVRDLIFSVTTGDFEGGSEVAFLGRKHVLRLGQ